MTKTVEMKPQTEKFTRFDEKVQAYFLEKEIVILLYPNDIFSEHDIGPASIKITSADQYYDYLERELDFWNKVDPTKKLESIARFNQLQSAKNFFDTALRYIQSPNSMANYLNQSIHAISQGVLSSNTNLSRELLKHIEESSEFLTGFKIGLLTKTNSSFSLTADSFRGFYAAMAYRGVLNSFVVSAEEKIVEFKTNVEEATKNYSSLNENYTRAFFEQEKRMLSIEEQTNNHFENISEKENAFFVKASAKLATLEKQYQENLKIKAPAQYWEILEKDYVKKGRRWFVASMVISAVLVGLFIWLLVWAPDVVTKEKHWLENAKNSAIITVITSLTIYAIRTTMKMSISSFHLARDAKERNNLSVFYLSLIEDDAVTDKERAIILNSLFSRSDTGLLKGDSAPTMTTNVSDLIDAYKNLK